MLDRHPFAICAVMKNEARYVAEWIEFHAAVGCSKFFLYDNESTDETRAVVEPYVRSGLVELTSWPRQPGQLTAYAHALDQRFRRRDAGWVAFIDLDEFLVPEGSSVLEALEPFSDCAAVAVHWLVFGSSGHIDRPGGLVIENYTWRLPEQHSANQHYKTIVNFRRARAGRVINGHGSHLMGGVVSNTRGVRYGPRRMVPGLWRKMSAPKLEAIYITLCDTGALAKVGKSAPPFICHDRLKLHHYYLKSKADWQARLARGDVNTGAYASDYARLGAKYDHDNIEDLSAARFGPAVRAALQPPDD
jgi:hypothetical protein